jgi:hypothetical protein
MTGIWQVTSAGVVKENKKREGALKTRRLLL